MFQYLSYTPIIIKKSNKRKEIKTKWVPRCKEPITKDSKTHVLCSVPLKTTTKYAQQNCNIKQCLPTCVCVATCSTIFIFSISKVSFLKWELPMSTCIKKANMKKLKNNKNKENNKSNSNTAFKYWIDIRC